MTVDDLTGYLKQHWLEHVSKMPPECDPEAGEVKEGVVNGEQMLVTNQQSAKLPEPCIGSFHDPSALVAAELAAIFIAPKFVVLPIWGNQSIPRFLNRSRRGSES